jgi:hypothetical protein
VKKVWIITKISGIKRNPIKAVNVIETEGVVVAILVNLIPLGRAQNLRIDTEGIIGNHDEVVREDQDQDHTPEIGTNKEEVTETIETIEIIIEEMAEITKKDL